MKLFKCALGLITLIGCSTGPVGPALETDGSKPVLVASGTTTIRFLESLTDDEALLVLIKDLRDPTVQVNSSNGWDKHHALQFYLHELDLIKRQERPLVLACPTPHITFYTSGVHITGGPPPNTRTTKYTATTTVSSDAHMTHDYSIGYSDLNGNPLGVSYHTKQTFQPKLRFTSFVTHSITGPTIRYDYVSTHTAEDPLTGYEEVRIRTLSGLT